MRWKLAVAWVGVQVLFFAGWAAVEQRRLTTGVSIHVRTVPVDPRDLLRGQYLNLSYEFSRWQPFADAPPRPDESPEPDALPQPGQEVWAVLRDTGEYHVLRGLYPQRPRNLRAGEVALLGRADGRRVLYGIEEYFVPEGSETPASQETTVRLRVGNDGKPRIEAVLVRGRRWP